MSLFSCSYSFSLYKSRKPCTLSWYAKCCKSERSNLIRWRYVLHLFCSTFWNTSNGNILPFFAFRRKIKNPDFVWKSGFYCLLLFFYVVPPGIEPGTQGFSVLCSTNWAMAPFCFFGHCRIASAKIGSFLIPSKFFGKKVCRCYDIVDFFVTLHPQNGK